METTRTIKLVKPERDPSVGSQVEGFDVLVSGPDTDGAYSFLRFTIPSGECLLPVFHASHAIGIYVHQGNVTLSSGREKAPLPLRSFTRLSSGEPIEVDNAGPTAAELYVIAAPAFSEYRLLTAEPDIPEPPLDIGFSEPAFRTVREGEGRTVAIVSDLYRMLAVSEETGGAYAIWEAVVAPQAGPPPHYHTREEEGFLILEGEMTFYTERDRVTAGPGTFLNAPKHGIHRFRNETDAPARMLILVAPGGMEGMLFEAGDPVESLASPAPPFTDEKMKLLLATAPKYGIHILPPA